MLKKMLYLFLTVFILILIFPIWHISKLKTEDKIFIENGSLVISGEYNTKMPLDKIDEIFLEYKLPSFQKRLNGFSLSNIKKGYFIKTDSIKYYINVNSTKYPFIFISSQDEIPIIINRNDSIETISLYKQIQLAMEMY